MIVKNIIKSTFYFIYIYIDDIDRNTVLHIIIHFNAVSPNVGRPQLILELNLFMLGMQVMLSL